MTEAQLLVFTLGVNKTPGIDTIYDRYIERQGEELEALAAESDVVAVSAIGADRFIVTLEAKTLVSCSPGMVEEADSVTFGLWVHDGFLRCPDLSAVITLLSPRGLFHSNVKGPLVCVGPIEPGASLVELVARVHQLVTFNEYTCDERDAFNREACVWIRRNLHRLPLDSRPLKSRRASLSIETGMEDVVGVAAPSGGLPL